MASLKKCIENMCKGCTYDQSIAGTWREQVELCTVKSCALWEVRPMTVATINLQRKERGSAGVPAAMDIDALLDSMEDEDDEGAPVSDMVAA